MSVEEKEKAMAQARKAYEEAKASAEKAYREAREEPSGQLRREEASISVEEQIYALHTILHAFETKGLLSDDPASVCIEREGRPPVYPCGRGYPGLNLDQVDWAFEHKQFWFLGAIKTLWLELDTEKAEIDASKVEISKWSAVTMAEKRGFTMRFERYAEPKTRRGAGSRG